MTSVVTARSFQTRTASFSAAKAGAEFKAAASRAMPAVVVLRVEAADLTMFYKLPHGQ